MSDVGILKDAKEIFLAKFGYFDGGFVKKMERKFCILSVKLLIVNILQIAVWQCQRN